RPPVPSPLSLHDALPICFYSGSLALLSDAGHMLSDVVAQGLSLGALYLAARPADERRTYGWYRIEILAALMNGVALFALSAWIEIGRAHVGTPVTSLSRM